MNDVTIQILATIGECGNFQSTPDAPKEIVSIVIAPLKIQNTPDRIKTSEGCNMFEGCWNRNCYYSVAARTKSVKPS